MAKIVSLPEQETEHFNNTGALMRANGDFVADQQGYLTTDYIDISLVDDIVYAGIINANTVYASLCCYDENMQFVRVLLPSNEYSTRTFHCEPDGTYKYVRASSRENYDYSLQIHYRNRG